MKKRNLINRKQVIGLIWEQEAIDNSNCSVAGIAAKSGNYFLITASHCFSGTVASDGTGRLVTQNSYYVGRQHAQAMGVNLDFALVKIMDNGLSGGRYAEWN
ncbi:hypothetical protein [Lysinibacillus sp. NPDC047702]|uniref:hypothetical protein n=1 Tax=unclassified Lysinibacillus TaxID=2636778 RepID=UPI003D083E02